MWAVAETDKGPRAFSPSRPSIKRNDLRPELETKFFRLLRPDFPIVFPMSRERSKLLVRAELAPKGTRISYMAPFMLRTMASGHGGTKRADNLIPLIPPRRLFSCTSPSTGTGQKRWKATGCRSIPAAIAAPPHCLRKAKWQKWHGSSE